MIFQCDLEIYTGGEVVTNGEVNMARDTCLTVCLALFPVFVRNCLVCLSNCFVALYIYNSLSVVVVSV